MVDYTFFFAFGGGTETWTVSAGGIGPSCSSECPSSASATVTGGTADEYLPIQVAYANLAGAAGVRLEWSGPGIPRQAVPAGIVARGEPG